MRPQAINRVAPVSVETAVPASHRLKGEIVILSGADVRRLMSMKDCISVIERAMRTVSRGGAKLPLRIGLRVPGDDNERNIVAVMPGYLEDPPSTGAKVIAVYSGNARRGLPSHMGVVALFDPADGVPLAILDAGAITGLRTAAASAVATNVLARSDASHLAVLGTGEQAAAHVHAMTEVRRIRSICVWGRSRDAAQAFADRESRGVGLAIAVSVTAENAVSSADIVCTTTSSREPILHGAWIGRGTHVNLVGASSADAREADEGLVVKAKFFVDLRESALAQAGELLAAMGTLAGRHIRGEIGEVLNGTVPGRTGDDEVTVYKSLGIAAQDLAVARVVYERALERNTGTWAAL